MDGFAVLPASLLDLPQDVHPRDKSAENDVLAVERGRAVEGDEELRAVGMGTGVGHAQQPRPGVGVLEALVRKVAAVYGLPAAPVAS